MVRGVDAARYPGATLEPVTPVPQRDLDDILNAAGPDLDTLRSARVLVTGASGFVGGWLLEALARADHRLRLGLRVVALCRDPGRIPAHLRADPAVELVAADVRSLTVGRLDGSVDAIIHAATPASAALNAARPIEMIETIVEGMRRLLDVAASFGAIPLLFTSSGAVYGPLPSTMARVDEDYRGGPDPLDPRFAYHEAKRMAELLCSIAVRDGGAAGVQVKIARLFAFVGPRLPLDAHFAIGNFIRDRLSGRDIVVEGDGTAVRSYMYAADMVMWLLAVLVRGVTGRAYNVGSERAVEIATLASAVATLSGRGPIADLASRAVHVRGVPTAGASIDRYVPATDRARTELQLDETVDLDVAVRRTIEWHLLSPGRVG